METLLEQSGWELPSLETSLRVGVRLLTAAVLGGIVGLERERRKRAAGLRTHIMVSLGAALFVLVPLEVGGGSTDLAQIVKGIAAGVGFLGAGAILKNVPAREIEGLTTAATIWVTAAVGLASGAGQAWLAAITMVISLLVLIALAGVESDPSGKM